MLAFHEVRVAVKGDVIDLTFYKKTRAGRTLVGKCTGKKSDRASLVAAFESEYENVLTGKGSRGK